MTPTLTMMLAVFFVIRHRLRQGLCHLAHLAPGAYLCPVVYRTSSPWPLAALWTRRRRRYFGFISLYSKKNHPHPRPALLDSHRGVWGAWSAKTRHDTPGIKEAFAPRRFHLCDLSVVAGSLALLLFLPFGLFSYVFYYFPFGLYFRRIFLFVFAPTTQGLPCIFAFLSPFRGFCILLPPYFIFTP